jgi:HlyD family secretion protein
MRNILHSVRSRPWLAAGIVAALALIGYLVFGRGGEEAPEMITVERGTIREEVSVTGKTGSTEDIELAFEKSGRVVKLGAKVGDRVSSGQMLVQLDQSELLAQLSQAQANVMREQARLDQLVNGARPEDLAIKRTELLKAQQDLASDYASGYDVLQAAYANAEDAVGKQIDQLFVYKETPSVQLSFDIPDSSKKSNASRDFIQARTYLATWKNELSGLSPSSQETQMDQAFQNSRTYLYFMRDFLARLMEAVVSANNLSADTSTTYKTNVSAGRTEINSAITSITSQEQQISSQKLVVQRIENELSLKLAGTAVEEIDAQRAQVRQFSASVASIQAQLSKTVLRSPINGVVTEQKAKVGQIVSPNAIIVSVISDSNFEITTNIPEADVQKVKVGDKAAVTLDAYGSDIHFEAQVSALNPAETLIEGVVTYEATLVFLQPDDRIKSGMTANIDIRTNERNDVIVVPQRSVLSEDGERFVFIFKKDGEPERHKITTGLRGTDGNVEVVTGLSGGEIILSIPPTE